MTLQTDLEAAVAQAQGDSNKLKAIVNGPASGAGSTVETDSGSVKSVARAIAEIGDTSNQATKTLDNVANGDFASKAAAAGVGDMLAENNLSDLPDAAAAREHLELGSAAVEDVAVGGSAGLLRADGDGSGLTGIGAQENRIINGDMIISQRGTSFTGGTLNADGAYTLDRWYVLSEGNDSVDVTQNSADAPSTGEYCIALDVETTGEKFGISQIIEAVNCRGLIGQEVTVSFKAKVSNARIDTVKAGIVAWSGTADSVTKDIVSAWNADGTTPTLIANATFENTPADLGVTTDWATYSVTATIDTASAKQIIIFLWSDDATNPLAGDFLYITDVQLKLGSSAGAFPRELDSDVLAKCQRYWEQTYPLGVAAGANTVPGAENRFMSVSGSTGYNIGSAKFRVRKRVSPTVTIYSKLGTPGRISDGNVVDMAANSGVAGAASESGFNVNNSSGGTLSPDGENFYFHFTADAELGS